MASHHNDAEAFLRTVMMKLSELNEDLSEYAQKESFFSSEVASEMKKIKTSLATTLSKLQLDYDRISGASDPIVQLLNSHNLRVVFDSIHQNIFRIAVLSLQPTKQQQIEILQRHLYPIYLSTLPVLLSDHNDALLTRLQLPKISTDQFRTPPVTHESINLTILLPDSQRIPLACNVSENVLATMKQLLPRLLIPGLQLSTAAFKVLGLNEYIYGDHQFSQFLSVREAVHKNQTLTVQLITMQPKQADHVFINRILTFWKSLRLEYYAHTGLPIESEELSNVDGFDGQYDFVDKFQENKTLRTTNHSTGDSNFSKGSPITSLRMLRPNSNYGDNQNDFDNDRMALHLSATTEDGDGTKFGNRQSRFAQDPSESDDPYEQYNMRDRSQSRAPRSVNTFCTPALSGKSTDSSSSTRLISPATGGSSRSRQGNTYNEEELDLRSRFNDPHLRGVSVAPAAGSRSHGVPGFSIPNLQAMGEDDDDDQQPVLRPLGEFKQLDSDDEVRVTKLSSLTSVNYEMDDDDRFSKRMSGVLHIPSGLMTNNNNNSDLAPLNQQSRSMGIHALRSSQMLYGESSSDEDQPWNNPKNSSSFFDHGPSDPQNAQLPINKPTQTLNTQFGSPTIPNSTSLAVQNPGFEPISPLSSLTVNQPLVSKQPSNLSAPTIRRENSQTKPQSFATLRPTTSQPISSRVSPSPTSSQKTPTTINPENGKKSTQVGALDFRGEVLIQRDIQQRRRRSIVREVDVNDSDEEDLGITPTRSRRGSLSTNGEFVEAEIPTDSQSTLRIDPTINLSPRVLHTRPSSRASTLEPSPTHSHNSNHSQIGDLPSTLAPVFSSTQSVGSTASTTPSSTGSQNAAFTQIARRGSLLSGPSKNTLFKFSTLTHGGGQDQDGNSPTPSSLSTFNEFQENILNEQAIAGRLFIPTIGANALEQIHDDDVLFSLNLNQEGLEFDLVARHRRLLDTSLVADMTLAAMTGNPIPALLNSPSALPTVSNLASLLQQNQTHPQAFITSSQQSANGGNTTLPSSHSANYPSNIVDLAHQCSFKLPPFQLKVLGVDNVTNTSCPRLGSMLKGQAGESKLSIVAAILTNNTTLRSSLSITGYHDVSIAPRWNQTIIPQNTPENQIPAPPIQYFDIPRHSKIAFLLVESILPESPKEIIRHVPLAWASMAIFQETDLCVQGLHHLELWPIANAEGDCSELGASQHLVDPYNAHGGRLPKKEGEKESKKSKKDDKTPISFAELGIGTVIDGLDIIECPYLFRGATGSNFLSTFPAMVSVEFPSFNSPVVNTIDSLNFPEIAFNPNRFPQTLEHCTPKNLPKEIRSSFDVILASDALHQLTDTEKEVIWLTRESISQLYPHLLPLFIQSVNWTREDHRHEALRLLELWRPPRSFPSLIALLDSNVTEFKVRSYAVRWLEKLSEFDLATLQLFLLQLTQCLKFEPYHNSPLVRFLLDISIKHPYQIGHYLYWHLKNETACDPPFSERYRVILEAYLTFSPLSTDSLRTQQHIIDEGSRLATKVRNLKNAGVPLIEYMQVYQQGLQHLNRDYFNRLPGKSFQIPLDPRWQAQKLIPEKCKIMSSKMAPLWLVFQNADPLGSNFYTIFKAGDDLRQDILTLQILRFLDKIWIENGLDLRLSPYNVLATGTTDEGKGCGMIQVVLNSTTTSAVQAEFGGGATGAFKEDTLWQFLVQNNPEKEDLAKAVDNFSRSCAGYCVATYVLGIGDRHNGNIMITNDGHLFHIDFGHFLGNFKSKMGINRERSRFVFTKEMAYAMGGSSKISSSKHPYKVFVEYCVQAIELVRQHAAEIETLFLTMVGAGMPELLKSQDILYIRDKLALLKTSQATKELFLKELDVAINCTSRTWDNFMHNLKHR